MKNKNLLGKSSSGSLFSAKILKEAAHLTSPNWAKSLTKFNNKMQDFKRALDCDFNFKDCDFNFDFNFKDFKRA